MTTHPEFPMRINKYLAQKKYATRRGADEIIAKKQVFINGRLAVLGDKVREQDVVEVKFRGKPTPLFYEAFHKPRGITTDSVPGEPGMFAVNGLDKEAHGLVIFTNDGRMRVDEKEYIVVTKKPLRASFKEKIEAGVLLDDGERSAPCAVKILNENTFRIVISGEKKYPIRRVCSALFQEVKDLQCIRVMGVRLGNLQEGGRRELTPDERKPFLFK